MRRLLVVVGLSACGFDGSPGVPVDGQPQPDGSGCTPGFVNLCGLTPLEQDLVVDFGIAKEVDTDMASCTAVMQSDGTSVCLLYYQNISIAGTLFAHGSRPLALRVLGVERLLQLFDGHAHAPCGPNRKPRLSTLMHGYWLR